MIAEMKIYQIATGGYGYMGLGEYEKAHARLTKLAAVVPSLEIKPFALDKEDHDEEGNRKNSFTGRDICEQEVWLNSDELLLALEIDGKIEVKSVVKQSIDLSTMFKTAAAKNEEQIVSMGGDTTYNQKCEVHMPSQALATYNETMLMENSCTDELQNQLAMGWRIIAACPQPDQRRPDYILGRFNPECVETSASRG